MKTKKQMLNELVLCYDAQGYDIWGQIFTKGIHIDLIDWMLMQDIIKEEFKK